MQVSQIDFADKYHEHDSSVLDQTIAPMLNNNKFVLMEKKEVGSNIKEVRDNDEKILKKLRIKKKIHGYVNSVAVVTNGSSNFRNRDMKLNVDVGHTVEHGCNEEKTTCLRLKDSGNNKNSGSAVENKSPMPSVWKLGSLKEANDVMSNKSPIKLKTQKNKKVFLETLKTASNSNSNEVSHTTFSVAKRSRSKSPKKCSQNATKNERNLDGKSSSPSKKKSYKTHNIWGTGNTTNSK